MAQFGVCLALFASAGIVPGQSNLPTSMDEQRYWKEKKKEEQLREKAEMERERQQREQIKAMLPQLIEDGRAAQTKVLEAQDGPPLPPEPPSFFEGKRDYVLLGLLFVLVPVLVGSSLSRLKRESEIRVLAGTYLADDRQAAAMTMPALFDTPSVPSSPAAPGFASREENAGNKATIPKASVSPQAAEFFAQAPERLTAIRKLLSEFGKAFDDAERQQVLSKLHEIVEAMRTESGCWELRPAWQMSSSLAVLIERLIAKTKEATPSTLRTVASAIDVLGEVCVQGVRPDLIITPPISVLAVDDDPLCLRAVVFALEKAGITPDVAGAGEKAVELATGKPYDVIFMDIQMPGIDGLAAAEQIRGTQKNSSTPVIFVTIRSDFQTRAESSRIGGTDLIAKPFLQFEITVKALTFAMRKRLQLAASLQRATVFGSVNRVNQAA